MKQVESNRVTWQADRLMEDAFWLRITGMPGNKHAFSEGRGRGRERRRGGGVIHYSPSPDFLTFRFSLGKA